MQSHPTGRDTVADDDLPLIATAPAYKPPSLTELGSLADLTQGGIDGDEPDGFGTAGARGSI